VKPFLFVNPRSGSYAAHRVSDVLRQLEAAEIRPTVFKVTCPQDTLSRCQIINASEEPPLVIVAAGDGTINAVLNGLRSGKATLAVLPLGTSNVLAAELGIFSVQEGITRISAGRTRLLAVGVIELGQVSHRFALMAGIGMDGAVVRDVRPLAKRILKQGAYALSAITGAFNWDRNTLTVRAQGKSFNCHSVIICNAAHYGGTFKIAPESDLFTPQFTVVCVTDSRRRSYLKLAMELLTGQLQSSRNVARISADEIEIQGVKPIQIDGDFVGYSPASLRTMADFARIIV